MNINKNNEIIKEYGISTLKGLIGAIPYVGTLINESVFEARNRLKQKRVNLFIEDFSDYIRTFSKKDIELSQIKREEFGDFFEALLVEVSKLDQELN